MMELRHHFPPLVGLIGGIARHQLKRAVGLGGPADIKAFASAKLADFKVPRVIKFIDEIPKGATGKLQRIGLAEKLGMTS